MLNSQKTRLAGLQFYPRMHNLYIIKNPMPKNWIGAKNKIDTVMLKQTNETIHHRQHQQWLKNNLLGEYFKIIPKAEKIRIWQYAKRVSK